MKESKLHTEVCETEEEVEADCGSLSRAMSTLPFSLGLNSLQEQDKMEKYSETDRVKLRQQEEEEYSISEERSAILHRVFR